MKNINCSNCHCGIMCTCKKTNKENVHHPDHYLKDSGHEVIDVINAWKLNFSLGNAIKYIARAGKKDPNKTIEDLRKAKEYIDIQIKHIKSGCSNEL